MQTIRILVVDDSPAICRLLSDVLVSTPGLQVVATAANGRIAISKIAELTPDIVILDLLMPIMNGLETLKEIRILYPQLPVIMLSTLTHQGGPSTLEALSLGASDYVVKPGIGPSPPAVIDYLRRELVPRINNLVAAKRAPVLENMGVPPACPVQQRIDIVAIGVSTGGPNALAELLPQLPANFPVPIVIVQHMPAMFTHLLAERLDTHSALTVGEAGEGQRLEAGRVYFAPGGSHMRLSEKRPAVIELNQEPPQNSCRPSVDVLFRSVAATYGSHVLGIVLSGMGSDGTSGSQSIRDSGGEIWVQDRSTSIVWGMPGSIAMAGLANRICPLHQIAAQLTARASIGRRNTHRALPGSTLSAKAGF